MNQVQFLGTCSCFEGFVLNKMRLNCRNGKVVCANCGAGILEHETASEEDVAAYLSHLEGSDGGNCVLSASEKYPGTVWCGGRGISLKDFVEKHSIQRVVNASNLHLEQRSDFRAWAEKVEQLERDGVIQVLRLGWIDSEEQLLVGLEDAIRYIHRSRIEGVHVAVHCAQGKSRSGAVVIGYMMAELKISFEDAWKQARHARAMIEPNVNFQEQLRAKTASLHALLL